MKSSLITQYYYHAKDRPITGQSHEEFSADQDSARNGERDPGKI